MSENVLEKIAKDIQEHPVVLYMKGTPSEPMCGFSAQVVQVLNSYGTSYHSVNVLEDYDVREGIKKFSSWPTIPQLYVKGNFVGGCDITMTLHRKGELKTILGVQA